MLHFTFIADGFALWLDDLLISAHRSTKPAFFIGYGEARMDMYRGNFDIEDHLVERIALKHATKNGNGIALSAGAGQKTVLTLSIDHDTLKIATPYRRYNRFWLRLHAEQDEHVWGGGEQMSYFNLSGRRFPLWSSEPGVGRDKTTAITQKADTTGRAGGDYYHTSYPQPTFISSRFYALHVETTAYSVFDFCSDDFHGIEVWNIPNNILFFKGKTFVDIVSQLTLQFGRQPHLPNWVYKGAILGLKDGEASFERLDNMLAAGVKVSAIWCEDWVGLRKTSFGSRLMWDWHTDKTRYPNLPERIAELKERGIGFLGYVNPYLAVDGKLYSQAADLGYLVTKKNAPQQVAHIDFGEFDCAIVDLTKPEARQWFANRVIAKNMLDIGMSGWMADFGEYLPTDVELSNGMDARLMHNHYPVLWGKVNALAVASRKKTGDILWFMRAGFTGIQQHCPLLWAGDQSVDFSRHDGIATVICGALSCGLLGNAYHHSDIGGYTSLFDNVRSAELMMRWSEMAAFTPVMRSHEGNRPKDNLQIDQDARVLAHFARMTQIYCAISPYLAHLSTVAATIGLPVQRPLFLHYPNDRATYGIADQYLYGADMLVAPVVQAGKTSRAVYFPDDEAWEHVWTTKRFTGGKTISVPAPIGYPAVFFRPESAFANVFRQLRSLFS